MADLRSVVLRSVIAAALVGVALAGADAATVVTKISLADFKAAYGLSSVRGRVSAGGNGVTVWGKRFREGGKVDLSKSFVFIRVRTPPAGEPVSSEFAFNVQNKPWVSAHPPVPTPVVLTCSVSGTGGTANKVTCGGVSVSPT
jgi:hypothetical protein